MKTFEQLKNKNPQVTWIHADDPKLSPYGRVLDIDTSAYLKVVEEEFADLGTTRVVYNASSPEFEALEDQNREVSDKVYGQMPIQVGCCYGFNSAMNAMEWHHGSEVNVMATDTVLLLATFDKVDQGDGKLTFDSKDSVAVFVPKGYAIEVYSMVLHFAPIQVDENGFFVLVILPQDTNTPLKRENEDDYLVAVNKWLIAHPDLGRRNDITGPNIKIAY
ncbi:MAG TPA: DUF4867 family protein [Clostridia bacterium]|nr:DUF4867 family protein [Clostridia bacterium]